MRLLAALVAALATLACSNSAPAQDPAHLLKQASDAMSAVRTVAADVKFGPNLQFQGFTLQSATSKLTRTGESDTTIKVKQNDFLVDIRVVTTGGRVYLKVPFSSFQQLTPAQAGEVPDLGALMDPKSGLPSVLPLGQRPRIAGNEQVGGTACTRIDTVYTAAQAGAALGGFKPAGDVKASVWIGDSDHLVRRVILAGPLVDASSTTTIQVDLHDFNAPVTVVTPSP